MQRREALCLRTDAHDTKAANAESANVEKGERIMAQQQSGKHSKGAARASHRSCKRTGKTGRGPEMSEEIGK